MQVMETLAKFKGRPDLSLNASELVMVSDSLTQQSVISYALKIKDVVMEPALQAQSYSDLK